MKSSTKTFEEKVAIFKKKILALYPGTQQKLLDLEVIDDFAKMGACLAPDTIIKHLKKIETTIYEDLKKQKLLTVKNDEIIFTLKPNSTHVSSYGTLTKFFEKWAHANGFNQGGFYRCLQGNKIKKIKLPNTIPTLIDYVRSSSFRMLQTLGYIFRDLGAAPLHGDMTHAIALFVNVEENKEKKFLKYDPSLLYKMMGSFPYISYSDQDDETAVTPWDVIFDSMNVKYLTTPEILHSALQGETNEVIDEKFAEACRLDLPILSSILRGRVEKRMKRAYSTIPEKVIQAEDKFFFMEGIEIDNAIFFKSKKRFAREAFEFVDYADEIPLDLFKNVVLKNGMPNKKLPIIPQILTLFKKYKDNEEVDFSIFIYIFSYLEATVQDEKRNTLNYREVATFLTKQYAHIEDEILKPVILTALKMLHSYYYEKGKREHPTSKKNHNHSKRFKA